MPSFFITCLFAAAAVSQPVLGSPLGPVDNGLAARDLASDAEALKDFKSKVTKDPTGVLSSWGKTNDVCSWDANILLCDKNPFNGDKLALAGIGLNDAQLDGPDLNLDFLPKLEDLTFFRK